MLTAKSLLPLLSWVLLVSTKYERFRVTNNGMPIPPGYHSYLVSYEKKANFSEQLDKQFAKRPKDFSTARQDICTGIILTRRWVLTRAAPIAYYPLGSYTMIVEKHSPRIMEIDFVLVHPDHQPGDAKTDLALTRAHEELKFSFEVRNVNGGFPGVAPSLTNCKLALWALHYGTRMTKSEHSVELKSESCENKDSDFDEFFVCLSNKEKKFQPCSINSGAPIICDSVLLGVYIGNKNGAVCDGDQPTGYMAIRIDNINITEWITNMILPPVERNPEEEPYIHRMCKAS